MATKKKTGKPVEASQAENTQGYLTRIVNGVETVLTVDGAPVPIQMAHLVPYAATDQGRAEDNEGKEEVRARVMTSEWDNMIAKRGDPDIPIWASPDPMKEAVEKHGRPGMAHKFLSPRHIDKRGLRHYEIVRDGNGNPIKVGNMLLGEMPVEMREARNRHYQQQANDELAEAEANYRTDSERALRDEGISRDEASILRSGDSVRSHDDPDRSATIGFRSRRGEPL
jgi:antitoxin (DNA-binding transcriptional repressor) of toxin-antitoxin stability system